jgi:hypothetical protein
VSENLLTGPLPTELFSIEPSNLQVFAAVRNFWTGYIPPEICNAENLEILALDGLRSAENCQIKMYHFILPSIFKQFMIEYYFQMLHLYRIKYDI